MRLVFIHKSKRPEGGRTLELFKNACEKLNVELLSINVYEYDYFDLPVLGSEDILYRSATGERARVFEKLLINDTCRHFYTYWDNALRGRGTTYFYHKKYNLPAIPTTPLIPKDRGEVERFAKELGGFPIVVKATGGSKGVGVMRVDSQKSLVSICDFLRGEDVSVILRKYIEHEYYGRLIVIGDKVVASNRAKSLDGDFRTNTSDTPNGEPFIFSEGLQKTAVKAVSTLGLEFGGVDLLLDEDGTAQIAEVNFPTDFGCCQDITGIDIAARMLEFAMQK